ncbi:TPA: hypothetical protein ACXNIW_000770 [Proteus mirabilis]
MTNIVKASDVFKVSRGLPLNYTEREYVDKIFIETLTSKNHIIIYGSSKQGKTSLHKSYLKEDECINISCVNTWNITELQLAILKKVGFNKIDSSSSSDNSSLQVKLKFPFIEIGGEIGRKETENQKHWSINPKDVNDVINIIKEVNFSKYIILEDFHYLPVDTQRDFAYILKAYHELSDICFIIVGVWLENDRLTVYNGDLTGRVISVNADEWNKEDLYRLIEKSEKLLNITFNQQCKENLLKECNGNVFLVQRICAVICEKNGIHQTQIEPIEIGGSISIEDEIVNELGFQNSRYNKFITEFSKGLGKTKYDLYKWILYVILTVDKEILQNNLYIKFIRNSIKEKHPNKHSITKNLLLKPLSNTMNLQLKLKIQPIIFEYDENKEKIKIVDKYFILWREKQNQIELIELLDLYNEDTE